MSEISIIQRHDKDPGELRELVLAVADKLNQRYDLKSRWLDDNRVELYRHGIKGLLVLREREVEITITLGLLMRPLRSTIQNAVASALADRLGE